MAVTTSADAAERICVPLVLAELDPVVLPCIEVRAAPGSVLDGMRSAARVADHLLLTSVRTVQILWPEGGMPPVPVAAVGGATARAVEQAGGMVETIGPGDGDDLIDLLLAQVAGRRIVFPHARSADPGRAERLRRAGALVDAAAVYDTIPLPPGPDPVDAALFGSASAVEGWCLSRTLSDVAMIGAMGPTTAAALSTRGRPADFVPDHSSIAALVAGLSSMVIA